MHNQIYWLFIQYIWHNAISAFHSDGVVTTYVLWIQCWSLVKDAAAIYDSHIDYEGLLGATKCGCES